MLEQILGYLEPVASVIKEVMGSLQAFVQKFIFGAPDSLLGAYVLIAVLVVGFLLRGIIRSFAKNPRTTIFFVVLFALLAAAWFAVFYLTSK